MKTPKPPIWCIALGSNLGDRGARLRAAVAAIDALPGTRVVRVSSFHETEPVGGPAGQGRYLNAAAVIETMLTPRMLLDALLGIEAMLGRVRHAVDRNMARTIDLDLVLAGDAVIDESGVGGNGGGLVVPHPRMHEREFVLGPVAEVAPDAVHPVLGMTVRELLERVRAQERMAPAGPSGGAR